jgi:malate dehydrogenase (oxaloacetate-decarboxylating)
MAQKVDRPVIFPLSNPTSRSEATPGQIVAWSEGRALIGTGSPFPPVAWKGASIKVTQTNNSYIFPGVGLGVIAVGARRITDAMFMAAGKAVADISPVGADGQSGLLPPVTELRTVALAVAKAVALQARADNVAPPCPEGEIEARIAQWVWPPLYRPYRRKVWQASP